MDSVTHYLITFKLIILWDQYIVCFPLNFLIIRLEEKNKLQVCFW